MKGDFSFPFLLEIKGEVGSSVASGSHPAATEDQPYDEVIDAKDT